MRAKLKSEGKKTLKKHYLFLVLVCLIAAFLGSEFTSSLSIAKVEDNIEVKERTIIGRLKDESLDNLNKEQKAQIEKIKKESKNPVLGRSRGVLSNLINTFATGNFIVTIIQAFITMGASFSLSIFILIILSVLISFFFWYLLTNTYIVISRRIFLESRIYPNISASRFLFLKRVGKWLKASFTMFVCYIYQLLWSLTIVGGFIKHYSYYLVPYIVAENPNLKASEAIKLSRDMMNGHKWECFVINLSFIAWYLLGIITLGLSNIFFLNPYKVATFSEYYVKLRDEGKKKKIKNISKLNDKYLYTKASSQILNKEYHDIITIRKKQKKKTIEFTGIKGFLIKYFGISILKKEEKEAYDKQLKNTFKLKTFEDAIDKKSYPERLSPVKKEERRMKIDQSNYLKSYNIVSLVLLFFVISFIGWVWECSLHIVQTGYFVNRGALHGPWLPIYGYGGVLILIILNRYRKDPLLEFFSAIVLCGIIEYFTAYFLEVTHNGMKWWDYSGYFLNLNGRICAEGLLVFGLGGLLVVYLIAPAFDNFLKKINYKFLGVLAACLVLLFAVDQTYSNHHPNVGRGISSARKVKN